MTREGDARGQLVRPRRAPGGELRHRHRPKHVHRFRRPHKVEDPPVAVSGLERRAPRRRRLEVRVAQRQERVLHRAKPLLSRGDGGGGGGGGASAASSSVGARQLATGEQRVEVGRTIEVEVAAEHDRRARRVQLRPPPLGRRVDRALQLETPQQRAELSEARGVPVGTRLEVHVGEVQRRRRRRRRRAARLRARARAQHRDESARPRLGAHELHVALAQQHGVGDGMVVGHLLQENVIPDVAQPLRQDVPLRHAHLLQAHHVRIELRQPSHDALLAPRPRQNVRRRRRILARRAVARSEDVPREQ